MNLSDLRRATSGYSCDLPETGERVHVWPMGGDEALVVVESRRGLPIGVAHSSQLGRLTPNHMTGLSDLFAVLLRQWRRRGGGQS